MYEPLHHKYRPQTFSQLVGQGAIADTLTHALEQNRIAPAYLFCGPRGTGKTSSARILAKSLNCLSSDAPTANPCGQCDICKAVIRGIALDVVEIDAASNTGVDNIRELIERTQFAPVQCRYKLYVLDEVHMLSTAAFNALLKTLEEPPNRVVFVLATTDPQRVLPTIISRCQRFDFRRIPLPSMVKHLSYIAAEEAIRIESSAVQLVAQISQGGLRDAESLLDQLSLQTDQITMETVWDLVGAVPERDLLNLVRAIAADDSTALLERVRHLMDKGREPLIVLQSLVGFYRDLLIAKRAPNREDLVAITSPTWAEMIPFSQKLSAATLLASQQKLQSAEIQVKNTTQPRLWLEITLTGLLPSALSATANIESTPAKAVVNITPPPIVTPAIASTIQPQVPLPPAARPTQPTPAEEIPAVAASLPAIPTEPAPPKAPPKIESTTADPAPSQKTAPPEKPAVAVAFGNLADLWTQILVVLQPRGTQMLMSQQGVLLGFDGVGAKVGFRSAPLQKAARERVPNLEAAFQEVFQRPIKISLEVVSTPKADTDSETSPAASASSSPADVLVRPQPPTTHQSNSSDSTADSSSNSDSSHDKTTRDSRLQNNKLDATTTPLDGHKSAAPSPAKSPSNSRLDAPANRQFHDQDQERIKRFASFFNGQIVNLDGETDSLLPDTTRQEDSDRRETNQQEPKSSDPGPDVPF